MKKLVKYEKYQVGRNNGESLRKTSNFTIDCIKNGVSNLFLCN